MGNIIMSKKEVNSLKIMDKLAEREISQSQAARILNITDRQVRNRLRRYEKYGERGLVHKSRGKPSKKRWKEEERLLTLELLNKEFINFGPTLVAEKLWQLHAIKVSKETVRRAMITSGLWKAKQRRSKHRKRRERKACLGVMIQLDGSPHDWFEGRSPKCTLLVFIDDATSALMWLEFVPSESTESLMKALKNYILIHGRPCSLYVDYGSVFRVNINNPDHDKITQFERAAQQLDIEMIHAHSPQAKGRVERANKTLQDRLIAEMRLAGISSPEAANIFIRDVYIPQHNARFAVAPADTTNVHKSSDGFDFDDIFCIKRQRLVANDFTVCYKKRTFQLDKNQPAILHPKDIVTISEQFNGIITFSIRNNPLHAFEIFQKQILPKVVSDLYHRPNPHHPWRKSAKPAQMEGYLR